jgi:hypothetical protein
MTTDKAHKPTREYWVSLEFYPVANCKHSAYQKKPQDGLQYILCREVVPASQDDSVTLSRDDWNNFVRFFNQDWIGPCKDIVKRIERMNKEKVGE